MPAGSALAEVLFLVFIWVHLGDRAVVLGYYYKLLISFE